HKIMPMPGTHKVLQPTAKSAAADIIVMRFKQDH
ncbi:MAG: hypothetical protein SCABRO_01624, partial [Candidatus Scalindua brodae]